MVVGRFAPSPTGPLHLGSLVAAVGSWLFVRASGGRWLVRMEDLDTARVVTGSSDEILRVLELYGLCPDGDVVWQSRRVGLYEEALRLLRERGLAFDCACSRAEVTRAASAPGSGEGAEGPVYPGTCRSGLAPGKAARAVRFRVRGESVSFTDRVRGTVSEDVASAVGDFVLRRADGPFAYQLAVVVDDAEQGIDEVVRGADLLPSTPRQILLQRALGLPQPRYAHLPLVLGPDGRKLGKRDGALPLEAMDERRIRSTLALALRILGQPSREAAPPEMLGAAAAAFDPRAIPGAAFRLSAPLEG